MIKIIYVQWVAASYKMTGDGFIKSGCGDGKNPLGRTSFDRRRARVIPLAAGGAGRDCQCETRFGEGEKLRRTRRRDRGLHIRSTDQLDKCVQRLMPSMCIVLKRAGR